jgi:hypothetical protein
MCLIVGKPKGINLPKDKALKQYFNYHPDGFGISFQFDGKVRTIKGAMTDKEMFKLISLVRRIISPLKVKDVDMVLQWRRAVTGSICRRYCHPFPVSRNQVDLDSLDVMSEVALAHNGVIWEYNQQSNYYYGYKDGSDRSDINDAQEFIKDYVVDLGDNVFNPAVGRLIESHTYSKFALLNQEGITYIGDFEQDTDGCWYSNFNHKPTPVTKKITISEGKKSTALALMNRRDIYDDYDVLGGVRCQFCRCYAPELYIMPDDDSLLCARCFETFAGYRPNYDDLAF